MRSAHQVTVVSVDAMKVCPHWMVTDIPGNAVEETQAGCSPDNTGPAQLGDTLPHARHQRPAGVPA